MLPFFPEQSQGPVTSLPEQDNALPKWWKEILPRLGVEWGGGAEQEEGEAIHFKWGKDAGHSV